MSATQRIYGLDILRSIAILTVVYGHGMFILGTQINKKIYTLFALDGVTLFFVLSGFLIGGILLKTIANTSFTIHDVFHFWIRRWWRTLPVYFLVLSSVIVYFYYQHIPLPPLHTLTKYFFFLQNLHSIHPSFLPELWSLAVEEWFYFLIPILWYLSFLIFKFDRKKIILAWIFWIIISVNLYRIYRVHVYNIVDIITWGDVITKQVLTRLDSIMIGVLGAYVYRYHSTFWNQYKTPFFIIGFILLAIPQIDGFLFQNIIFRSYFLLLTTSIGTLLLLPQLSSLKTSTGILYQFFTYISAISYSLYLVHLTIVEWLILPHLPLDTNIAVRYSLYWILSIILASLLYYFFEKPMIKLRDKLYP